MNLTKHFKNLHLVSIPKQVASVVSNVAKPRHFFRIQYLPFLVITSAMMQPLQAADIELSVGNITELSGTLYWSIFDNEDSYKTEQTPLVAGRSRVIDETLKVTLHDLPAGDYAIKLFHDANDNGEMDSNLLGLPQEGYGFSNNGGTFGPASFKDAKFTVQDHVQINIRLR
jgi:uncharacterized protein (DUF2141 family)